MRWPAQKTLSQVLCGVSAVTTKVGKGQVRDLKEANRLLKVAKEEAAEGRARVIHKPLGLAKLAIISFLDASFANETKGRSQQGMFQVAATTDALKGKTTGNQIEINSSKITRVVKSTRAAESASLGTALDRQLYVRLLFQVCMYGKTTWTRTGGKA